MLRKMVLLTGVATAALVMGAGSSLGSGFALMEQSVSGLGNAFAGGAAIAQDASTLHYNPAGMMRLDGGNAELGVHIIAPSVEFENKGTLSAARAPVSGGSGGDAGVTKALPNAYFVYGLDRVAFGLGINSPFGLETDYSEDWAGRYYATNSEILTVNVAPSVAMKITDGLSVGLGLTAMYLDASLSRAMDVGLGLAVGGFIPMSAASSPTFDAISKLEADGWAYGFNVGILYELNDNTRFGLDYRSRYKYSLDGEATLSSANPAVMAAVPFKSTGAHTAITMPDIASASVYHAFSERFAMMADVTWTHWSVLNALAVDLDVSPAILGADDVAEYNWKNTWRLSVGANYKPFDPFTLRCGIAYDQSPVPDPEHRTPRIPDQDRWWFALGAGYALGNFSFDAGYTFILAREADANNEEAPIGVLDSDPGLLKGTFDSHVNILSVAANLAF